MPDAPKYTVGQMVVVRDVNERHHGGPRRAPVVRVGRKLVQVEEFARWHPFRIEDGRSNSDVSMSWIQTEEEYVLEQARSDALRRLSDLGVEIRRAPGRDLTIGDLNRIADMVERAASK